MSTVFEGARLATHHTGPRPCYTSCDNDVGPAFTATLSDGSVRHYHTLCMPPGLLYAATSHGRYADHISGFRTWLPTKFPQRADADRYLGRLDALLKEGCAAVEAGMGADSARELPRFVEAAQAAQLECGICLDKVAYRPVSTGCHTFCQHCWTGWVLSQTTASSRESASCPTCRTEVGLARLPRIDRLLQRLTAALRVRCPNSASGCSAVVAYGTDGEGVRAHVTAHCAYAVVGCTRCYWRGPLADRAAHHCRPPHVPCSNASQGCAWKGPPGDLSTHVTQHCPWRVLQCATCSDDYKAHDGARHGSGKGCTYRCRHCHFHIATSQRSTHETGGAYLRLCANFLSCSNGCGAAVRRGGQGKHDDSCAEARVKCRRCDATMKHKNLDRHWDRVHGGAPAYDSAQSDDGRSSEDYY